MAAPERFAESQICSCTAGTVHTWPKASLRGGAAVWSLPGVSGHGAEMANRLLVTLSDHFLPNLAAKQQARRAGQGCEVCKCVTFVEGDGRDGRSYYVENRLRQRCLKVRPIIPGVLFPPHSELPKTYGDDHGYRGGHGVGNPIAVHVAKVRETAVLQAVRGGDRLWWPIPPRPLHRPLRYMAGIRLCGGRITERLALALFPLNEHDPD